MKKKQDFLSFGLFSIFLLSNTLLSYFSLSLEAKLSLGVLGLAFPSILAFHYWKKIKPLENLDFIPTLGPWAWVALVGLSLAVRFKDLTSLMVWPNFDESSYGFDAFHLLDGEPPRFFYGVSQAPPLFIWGLALFFKIFGVSLLTLWFFPGLISLSALPLAYLAARSYFSRSFSFLCAVLTALSFWPVFLGHFALMTILILPAECLALWAVGRFLRTSDPQSRKKSAAVLGLIWGAGFYTHLHWPVVVALTAVPVAVWFFQAIPKDPGQILSLAVRMAGGTFAVVLPLLFGAAREHYGGYLHHLWAFNEHYSFSHQITVWLSCLTSPFWGMDTRVHTYQPEWGGFLNPILTSLFFLGAMEIAARFERPLYRWLTAGLFLCFLPGLLTQDMEPFRLFPMVPLLIIGILIGFTRLARFSSPQKNLILFFVFLIPSLALDAHHLFGVYHHLWDDPKLWGSYTKSIGRYRAYGHLEEWRERWGPGVIFTDFVQGLPDQSLSVAVHDFNACQDPRLDPDQAKWAALLANVNYRPFLKARFPDGISYGLSKDFVTPDGGWMLFAFPLDQARRKTLKSWIRAQRALEPFLDKNLCYVTGQSFQESLEALSRAESSFAGDPFLKAVYWEKRSDLETKQELPSLISGLAFRGPSSAISSLEKAVQEGYPAAHLYEHLGTLWVIRQKPREAEKAFEEAVRAPLNLTDSSAALSALRLSTARKGKP